MRFAWLCLSVLLAALACGPARAGLPETPRLRQLSIADGLPSNIIYDMAEDADGYLWFATADGLARYDGVGFRVWRREDGLRDNEVNCVTVDDHNRIWIGTEKAGVAMLDAERRQFRYFDRVGATRFDTSPVWEIATTGDGAVWIGTSGAGLYRMRADGSVEHFMPDASDPRSLPGLVVTVLERTRDEALWVGTNDGTARWTGKDFERMPQPAGTDPYAIGLVIDRAGEVWIRTTRGSVRRHRDGRWSSLPWKAGAGVQVMGPMLQDGGGVYWVHASNGLFRAEGDAMQGVSQYSVLIRGPARPQYVRALEGGDGGLWFASLDAGVWHLPSNWRQFSVLTRDGADSSALGNSQVFNVAPSASGNLWLVGTSGVLDELDPESGTVRHVFVRRPPARVLYSVLEAADGKLWLGYEGAFVRLDRSSGETREWTVDSAKDAIPDGPIEWIAQDRDGRIWIWSQDRGLQARSADGRVVESVALDGARGLGPSLSVQQLRRGPDGNLWLAGSQGLLAWNPQARRFAPVPGISAEAVDGFDLAADGTVWVARFGAVEAYRHENGRLRMLRRLAADAGLPQATFRGVAIDRRGILWIASIRGLVRLDPQQATSRVYGLGDGLPGQEILLPPVPRPQDGRLVISASHGVAVFDPAVVRPSSTVPRLAIDAITLGNGAGATALPVGAPFTLDHDNRDLHVVARLLSFDDVTGNRYRFRLSGFDDGWVEAGANGERTFSRLAPGDYRLEVAGRTADNVWSRTQVVEFSVAPPWWRTWWALAAFALLGALLVWAAAAAYQRRIRRRTAWQLAVHKRELAEQASLAKTRFLATLGHEVRTPMTGVLGMSELLLGTALDDRQRGYTTAIQNAGKHLLRLVNDALDLARIEAGRLELDEQDFDLRELVDDVAGLVAPNARQRGLRFGSDVAATAPRALRGDPLRVRQILLNLLNNAVKFTERGGVDLQARPLEGGGVRFVVSDTGPGISAEQQARLFQRFEQAEGARTAARYGGSGLGLAICQELALAMGGHIAIDSTPGEGARFIVDLPLPEALAASTPSVATQGVPAPATRALSILLVEDDPTVAEVMIGLLQARGHAVRHAPHGLAALAETAAQRFDLGMLDLDLPGIDGLALARQLRVQGFAAPLLAVTARADGDAESLAKAAGFDGFLRKPATGDMLAGAIEALFAGG